MSVKTTYKDLGEGRLKAMLVKLGGVGVKVGVLAEEGGDVQANGAAPGVTVADVAAWNEFGTDTIPERAFLRLSKLIIEREMPALQGKLLLKIVEGGVSVEQALEIMGMAAQSTIKETIRSYPWPPNAPSTIQKKGSSRPLIDSGQLINSIHYAVVRNGA